MRYRAILAVELYSVPFDFGPVIVRNSLPSTILLDLLPFFNKSFIV